MGQVKKKKAKKRSRIKYKSIFLLLLPLILIGIIIYYVSNLRVKNIYISDNVILSDQQIIDIAGLSDYPKITKIDKKKLKEKLLDNVYINNAKITYHRFGQEIDIEVLENTPLLYYQYDQTYLLSDGSYVKDVYSLPVLINQTPDKILNELLEKLNKLDKDILYRISEIRYYPSEVDEELFLLTMEDGNYVYINFNSFSKLNNYIDIIRGFDNRKGTLHLDSGDYLEIFEEKKSDDKSTDDKTLENDLDD